MSNPMSKLWVPIVEILVDEDLMSLAEENPDPIGEYRPEAEDIAAQLHAMWSQNAEVDSGEISRIVSNVFWHWFEVRIDAGAATRIADKIHSQRRLQPKRE